MHFRSTADARLHRVLEAIRNGGFHNASIEAGCGSRDDYDGSRKVPISRHFASGANGIRTRDLLLAKKPVRAGKVA